MSTIREQRFVEDIRQFNCPSCGNQLVLIDKKTKYVGCNYCGTVIDSHSEVAKIIMKLNSPSKYPPFSFLKLGLKAKIHGYEYKIIARTRWQTTHMEYWKEDGYEGYTTEKWVYDEWLLMGERFDYFYIVEDAEGFYISRNIIPEHPSIPLSVPVLKVGIDPNPSKIQQLNECGSAKVIFFEGESTYQIKPGDTIHYASYFKKDISYVIEWRVEEEAEYEIKEIEFFEERKLSYKDLKQWFLQSNEVQEDIFRRFTRYDITKRVFGWASLICLLLGALDYWGLSWRSTVLRERYDLKPNIQHREEQYFTQAEKHVFDSVYVKEISSNKSYPLTPDLLDTSVSYSALKDPNLEFATLQIDTIVKHRYRAVRYQGTLSLPKYPIHLKANTSYDFDFDPDSIKLILTDLQGNIMDTLYEHKARWTEPLTGYLVVSPATSFAFEKKGIIAVQERHYTSYGMLVCSIIFAFMWILYLPVSELIFPTKRKKI